MCKVGNVTTPVDEERYEDVGFDDEGSPKPHETFVLAQILIGISNRNLP